MGSLIQFEFCGREMDANIHEFNSNNLYIEVGFMMSFVNICDGISYSLENTSCYTEIKSLLIQNWEPLYISHKRNNKLTSTSKKQ